MVACVVCKQDNGARHSLRLIKDEKGMWIPQPVCDDCRRALISEAKASGKFIPFFSLNASQREADKRNGRVEVLRPFLEQFGRNRDSRVEFRKETNSRARRAKD